MDWDPTRIHSEQKQIRFSLRPFACNQVLMGKVPLSSRSAHIFCLFAQSNNGLRVLRSMSNRVLIVAVRYYHTGASGVVAVRDNDVVSSGQSVQILVQR
jgi:hypothetical protein